MRTGHDFLWRGAQALKSSALIEESRLIDDEPVTLAPRLPRQ
jgi:hypothetical protein